MPEPLRRHLDLPGLERQGQPALGTHLKALIDCIPNILQRLILGLPLTDAARNSRTLDDPGTVFITIEGHAEYHVISPGWFAPEAQRGEATKAERNCANAARSPMTSSPAAKG